MPLEAIPAFDEGAASLEAAEAELRLRLSRVPTDSVAWFRLGNNLHRQRRAEAALAAMERALLLDPNLEDARQARATLLLGLKRPREALKQIEERISRHTGDAELLVDAGIVLEELGNLHDALGRYCEALQRDPRNFRGRLNRGALLARLGRLEEALLDCQILVRAYIGSATAIYNLGNVLLCMERYEEARQAFAKTLSLNLSHAQARMGLGVALSMLGQFRDASSVFEQVERESPRETQDYLDRAARVAGIHAGQLPEIDPRLIFINRGLLDLTVCLWRRRNELIAEVRKLPKLAIRPKVRDRSLGFNMLALPLSQVEQREVARLVAESVRSTTVAVRRHWRSHTRLKIGYLSPDFRKHPSSYNHWRKMQLHDRDHFEVIALSLHLGDGSAERDRIMASCDRFIELSGLDNEAAAARIALEEIDILVDSAGYTEFTRPEILAARAAPINVQHMGTPGPSGGGFVDYRLTDAILTPYREADLWDEKLVWLPDTCWTCDDTAIAMSPPLRGACGLPEQGFVFCCFNKHYKIEPDVFDVWMRLLRQVKDSTLWLLDDTPASCANLRREAEARGVAARRLVFAPRCDISKHMNRHACADLFLDTLYYNAHTTAADALLAGLPVLTMPGESMAARVGASLVLAAGLPDMVSKDLAEYETKAFYLAGNPSALAGIRRKLRQNRSVSPLFDMPRRTREIEAAYLEMWRRHAAGLPPESFAVSRQDKKIDRQ